LNLLDAPKGGAIVQISFETLDMRDTLAMKDY
jgi:hypothetical protein